MFFKEDQYSASTTIYVYIERESNSASGNYYDSIISERMAKTYGVILKSTRFLSKVVDYVDPEGKYGLTTKAIASAISVKQIEGTELFKVYFTSSNKELTYKILGKIANLAETELKEIISASGSDVEIIDRPEMPTSPDSKQITKKALIGFLCGFGLSVAVLVVINRFDVVIHDKKKIMDNFDLPILGVIPRQGVTANKNGGQG